jgi:hypothetical protein
VIIAGFMLLWERWADRQLAPQVLVETDTIAPGEAVYEVCVVSGINASIRRMAVDQYLGRLGVPAVMLSQGGARRFSER